MLALGVFGGKYMTDCTNEFPASWFSHAKLCHERHDPKLNFFGVNASKPLSYWRDKGWIYYEDPRGWFQWYCRYYRGRQLPGRRASDPPMDRVSPAPRAGPQTADATT